MPRHTPRKKAARRRASVAAKRAAKSVIQQFRDGTLTDDTGAVVTDQNVAASIAMRQGLAKSGIPTGDGARAKTKRARLMDGMTF